MEEQAKPTRKRAKKSAETASPVQHKEQKTGGLAVVVVILIAIMVIVAIFFAAQNKKTRGLENEVTSLKDKIEGKLTDIRTTLDEQKEEQAKIDDKIDAKTKLPKMYKSSVAGFSVNYPISFVPEKINVKLDKVHVETFTIVRETDKTKVYAEEGGPGEIRIDVYENTDNKELIDWIIANAGAPYDTNFSKEGVEANEDGTLVYTMKKIGEHEFLTYTWSVLATGDEYFIKKDNFIIRISATVISAEDSVRQEIVPIIESLKF